MSIRKQKKIFKRAGGFERQQIEMNLFNKERAEAYNKIIFSKLINN
jgi:hypothetical protein